MKRSIPIVLAIVLTAVLICAITHRAKAQDAAAPAVATPNEVIDQIMSRIGQGRVDDAVAMMEGLKNQGDMQQAARNRLITLRDDQGQYHGYDIAAVQRFTPQVQSVDVLAYYDSQPVMFRFHFYRPVVENNGKWAILGFQVSTAVQEMAETLKDTPVDYVGNRAAKGQ